MIYDLVEVTDVMMANRPCLFCKCQLVTSFVIILLLISSTNVSVHYSYTTTVVPLRTEYCQHDVFD